MIMELTRSIDSIMKSDWSDLLSLSGNIKELMARDCERHKLSHEIVSMISAMIQRCYSHCTENTLPTEEVTTCMTETYRALRNSCVQCQQNQELIRENQDLLSNTKLLIDKIRQMVLVKSSENFVITLRCVMQFLGNFSSGNKENQLLICDNFLDCISNLFSLSDVKLSNYTCMLCHTCLSGNTENQTVWTNQNTIQILINLIDFCIEHDCEWGLFVIESICKVDKCFLSIFPSLKDNGRLLVLEVLVDQIQKTEPETAVSNLIYLAEDVKTQAYKILTLLEKHEDQNPVVTVKEIEVLGFATTHHSLYQDINRDKDLLCCIVSLLDAIHKVGKEGDNLFSRIDKITKTGQIDQDHAGYCLKRDLVKIIGNMAYKCKPNQDLIREMNGIPLVLDQTSIDGRNPYIQQWSILAIHNICEGNNDSKSVLSGLKFNGLAEEAETLKKYGIKAEVKDKKIVVRPPDPQ